MQHTHQVHDFRAQVESSDAFVRAGTEQDTHGVKIVAALIPRERATRYLQ
ncbi:MAG: hypothetical protein Q4A24_07965 [Akkermansia sp.]|nr:hypothetical protein [Akkermansia sp.]